jgi:hypothetical protein
MKRIVVLLSGLAVVCGCASIHSVSLTPISVDRKNQVQAQTSKVIIMHFNFDNDFVDEVVNDLKQQCPGGRISGILTKDEVINYFLYFVYKRQITAKGFCVPISSVSANPKKRRAASVDDESEL